LVERLVEADAATREGPLPAECAALHLYEEQMKRLGDDREHGHVDRHGRHRAAGTAHRETQPPRERMRSSATAARVRTSSGMVISGARATRASRVPSSVIIFM